MSQCSHGCSCRCHFEKYVSHIIACCSSCSQCGAQIRMGWFQMHVAECHKAAAVCSDCQNKLVTDDVGHCDYCQGETRSGKYTICENCANEKGICQLCLKSLKQQP